MGETLCLLVGILIIGLTIYDLLYTTFAPRGAGIISSRSGTFIWLLFRKACRWFKTRKALAGAGVVIIMVTIFTWVLLLWAGHSLVFLSDARAVVNSTTNAPATTWDKVYFTGYTLSTLGNGDFKGGTNAWRLYAAFLSFSGLVLITIAISYMVPIISAVTERRALSIRIASIGCGPEHMLLQSWNGQDFKNMEEHLSGLALQVAKQGQLHLAYPLLHYFYHADKSVALLLNMAALDEALTTLLLYVPKEKRPSEEVLLPLRHAITTFLDSLSTITPSAASEAMPEIGIKKLERASIPLQQPDPALVEQLSKRRKFLQAILHYVGWEWQEVSEPKFSSKLDLHHLQ